MKSYLFVIVLILAGCGLFDSGSKTLVGEYSVGWIDISCTMKIYNGPLGLMEGQIYHVGWDNDFIIAKRHPNCDKSKTDYFIIDLQENQTEKYSQTKGVYGPLDLDQFNQMFGQLGIPKSVAFSYKP
ncbi:hypothetical protein QWI17_03270 [Gilvimarinus sp. SDUM040013]|uniref:Lipoprotein n=1 Tax=Gilvimarinus gilvus TaxID=3058038 RepID=A0ABU4S3B7_9GAMM|nr:hypothetical protein [Gilvimarinus sp. SDUM040013]MDO3384856.1 hypothetical protein [Gilvimarinus sp. SDUM040013]MDX6851602.1 hypothetical protein [Gilvimarinus sp. SDUM040013]